MTPGELRYVHHLNDTMQFVEVIVSLCDDTLCTHARIKNSSIAPGYAGCGEVELREPLTVLSDPTGWRCSTLWSKR